MNKELKQVISRLKKDLKECKNDTTTLVFTDDLEIALNYIDNSISKEVIEEKIEEIRKARDTARDLIETKVVIADNDSLYSGQSIAHDYDINILKELLEQK